MTSLGRVTELWRYPISSLGGETLDQAEIGENGVTGDRLWGVENIETGRVAAPERDKDWRPIAMFSSRAGPSGPELSKTEENRWQPADSPAAAAKLSDVLGMPVRVRPHAPFETRLDGHIAPRYQRDDLHILTTASLARLAAALPDPAQAVSRRFRPNILIETGSDHPGYAEQALIGRTLVIGNLRVRISEPCARCAFTVLEQWGLTFDSKVLRHIVQDCGAAFGVLCTVLRPGRVALGDAVSLTEET